MIPGRWARLRDFDMFVIVSLIWFLAQAVRYVFPPLFGTFQEVYGVSNTTLGMLFTSLMLAYAGMQFPSGVIADRVGEGRVIIAGAVVTASGAMVAFGVRWFTALVGATILIGIGTGAHKTVAINMISRIYPQRTGGFLGTMDAIGHLGGAAGPVAVVFILSIGLRWGDIFLAIATAAIVLAVVFRACTNRRMSSVDSAWARVARADDEVSTGDCDGNSYVEPFFDPRFSAFVLVTVAYSITWNGMTAFLPLYLEVEASLPTGFAGLVFGSLFIAALVQPITGSLADRVGRHGVMLTTLGLAGGSLVVLVGAPNPAVAVVTVPLIGLGGHGFRPVRDAYLVETIPRSVGAGTLGIARTLMLGAGAIAPVVVGFLADTTGLDIAFRGLTIVLVFGIGIVGVLVLVERRGLRRQASRR